ncbi:hypothetical protein [Streptomyces sp. NPDC007856]|uniref:hypothetical protein n=1 Tax=Streptomyces sp. NPDC007856 TaxID=3364781 RepID=UPI003688B735
MTTGPVRRSAVLVAVGLLGALLPSGPAAAVPRTPVTAPHSPGPATTATTVTLVTGDKVTVTDLGHGKKAVTVQRPKGATGAVRTQRSAGEISVVPDEALPYLRAGTLDRRLFDVSGLIRQGLTDARAAATPLIVTYGRSARAAPPAGTEQTRSLPSLRGAAVEAGKGRTFWRSSPTATASTRCGWTAG